MKDLGLVLWYGEPWGVGVSWNMLRRAGVDRLNCGLLKMKHGSNVVVVDSGCELMLQPRKVICGDGQCCGARTAVLMTCLIRI